MIIKPKVRGFICTAAHPTGCSKSVLEQIDYVRKNNQFNGPKNVLIIGASSGYGLATRIAAAFGAGANTIGVFFERPAQGKRTASAGWYNSAAFEKEANEAGYFAKSINGDAFSDDIKQQTVDLIREHLGRVDLIVYSLAAPRRIHPKSGESFSSVLKPIGQAYTNKTVDPLKGEVKEITIDPATEKEIADTVMVMGGEDWQMWINWLAKEDLLAQNVKTLAYSYIGPELTHPIYKKGTIGVAKDHLQSTVEQLNETLKPYNGRALISVNKALVTQASSAIPVVPLYMSLLFKIMKEQGTHENCIEQMYRLLQDNVYVNGEMPADEAGRIRIDDREMQEDVQKQVRELWEKVNTDNLEQLTDIKGYREDFYRLFGFGIDGIDYEADVDPDVKIDSID